MKYVYGKNEVLEPIDRDAYIYRLESTCRDLGALVKGRRFHKTLLIFDKTIRESGRLEEIEEGFRQAGIACIRYEEIGEKPCFRTVNDGYNRCLLTGCDSVLCIGAKEAVDVGKGVNMLRFNGGTIER